MSDPPFHDGLPLITSPRNERLRLVKALNTRRARHRRGLYLIEGPKAIDDLLAREGSQLEQLLYRAQETLPPRAAEALARARTAGVPCYPVLPSVFDEVAPSESPQGLLAIAPLRWTPLEELCAPGEEPRGVAACLGVQDPGNLGTILRTARFFGLAGVVTVRGTQDPFAPKVVRSAAGALFDRPPATAETLAALLEKSAAAGLEPVALAAHGGEPLAQAELPARSLLLLGAEGPGLPSEATALRQVTIEGAGGQESLNVAIAFSLVAHAWCARWGQA
ncbi:MAG: RNA methyltransferase [Planctomycetes bacterium]|nr:RNA methyltransferase [Planctomycetota bacterium]